MTSIHTSSAALAAVSTLRSTSGDLNQEQRRISSGLRIETASDNAAYWSISTTMRSDRAAISAVADAIGLGAATIDTAYTGLTSVIDVLSEFKAKLVAAKEHGVDKSKIQLELDQLNQQVLSIAESSSFGGQNWLNTDISDIYDTEANKTSLVSSFVRDGSGNVSVKTMDLHLSEVSLYNSTGGGLLKADPRDMKTIGGIRVLGNNNVWYPKFDEGDPGTVGFSFSGPLTFGAGDQISFDVTVDTDDPATGIPGPYDPGRTTSIIIDRSTVDAVNASLNGVITTNSQYASVLDYALTQANAGASAYGNFGMWDSAGHYVHDPLAMSIQTNQDRSTGMTGSYLEVANFSSTVGSGGLGNGFDFGERGSTMTFTFEKFTVFKDGDDPDGVEVSMNFYVNGSQTKSYAFDRTYVNTLLGKTDGKVDNSTEMVTLLQSLLATDWPDVIIDEPTAGLVRLRSDEMVDRFSGSGTRIGFSGIDVSIEPLSTLSLQSIDVEQNPDMIDTYIRYLDITTQKIIDGAARLGALKSRSDMQGELTRTLMDTIDKGVGRLVDTDMNASSARLKALETREQLGLQALTIANAESENILRLFH